MSRELSSIEMLVLDVDGILTDGGLYVSAEGSMQKRFSIYDGAGMKLFLKAGHDIALISGHDFPGTVTRFFALGVREIHVGVSDKAAIFDEMLERRGLSTAQVAAMGDDVMDLPLIRRAGWTATVPDAHPTLRERVDHVTERRGGHGAVREVIEMILEARGELRGLIEGHDE